MSAAPIQDLSKLCIHTITTRPWPIETAAVNFARQGVKGITIWRNTLEGRNLQETGKFIRNLDLEIVSICRGGFFAHQDAVHRAKAMDDNRRAIEEAYELGTDLIVLVCGADPGQSLEKSRNQIQESISALLPEAAAAGVRLAIEPLHPMYADTRSAINTLGQANDMSEALNSKWVGVAIDVYHLWWDPHLEMEIQRCGKNNSIFAYHVCDWKTPTIDILNDRGLMGEGCIPLQQIRGWVEAAGFKGFNEVEIFSDEYWKLDQDEYLQNIIKSYKQFT